MSEDTQPAERIFPLINLEVIRDGGSADAVKTITAGNEIARNLVLLAILAERYRRSMTNIGYWVPADAPNSENTLVYIIAHKDREAAKKSWADFRADPAWQAVVKESQKDGPLTTKPPESVFLNPTDYSPIK